MSYLLKKDYSEQTDHIDFGNIMNNLKCNQNLEENLKGLKCDDKCGMCHYYNSNKNVYQYLPNPLPKKKADIFLICKEPSIGWHKNKEQLKLHKGKKISQNELYKENVEKYGYQNFIDCILFNLKPNEIKKINSPLRNDKPTKIEKPIKGVNTLMTALIKTFIGKYNYEPSIYITDLSKCAMDVNDANKMLIDDKGKRVKHKERDKALLHRYICCNNFLKWEIENLSNLNNTHFVFVGKTSFFSLLNKGKEKYKTLLENYIYNLNRNIDCGKISYVPHYALQNVPISLLEIFYDSDEDIENAKEEMKQAFLKIDICKYYDNNFYFSKEKKNELRESIENLKKYPKSLSVKASNISLILYTIYKKHFEKIL
jgi:hypothetical protein